MAKYAPLENPWSWALVFIFLLLLAWVLHQLWKIIREKHRLTSFHGVFLCIGVIWLPCRAFIFLSSSKYNASWVEIFYLLPTSLQFTDFALWAFFFANIEQNAKIEGSANLEPLLDVNSSTIHNLRTSRNPQVSRRNHIIFIIVMVVLYLVDFVVIGLTLSQNRTHLRNVMHSLQHGYSSFCYCTLASLLLLFGIRFSRLTEAEYSSLVLPRRPKTLVTLTVVLASLFYLHSLYDILFIVEVMNITTFPPVEYKTFLFFTTMEALPMAISLSLSSHIPSSGAASLQNGASIDKMLAQRYKDVRVGDYFHDYDSEGSVSRMSQRSFEGLNGLSSYDQLDSFKGRLSSAERTVYEKDWISDSDADEMSPVSQLENHQDRSAEDISFAKEVAKAFGRRS